MKRKYLLSIILFAATVCLATVAIIFLPDTVVTQISSDGNPSTMSKYAAVAVAVLLGAGGSVALPFMKDDTSAKRKCLIVSAAGIVVLAVTLAVNLI